MLEEKTEIENTRGENRDRKYQRRKQRQKMLDEKTEIENAKFKIALQWIKGT